MVTLFAQNEQNMNAVERVLHYTDLPPEGDSTPAHEPPASWPSDGGIVFSDVELAYRKGLPPVLMNVSFEVMPGEKVNRTCDMLRSSLTQQDRLVLSAAQVPGRARCSKHSSGRGLVSLYSQTLIVFFSMVELSSGKIEMDGINIRDIGLDVLRTRLALVPQDSTLFLGTLRENLSVISFSTSNLTHCDHCRDPQGLRTDAELISVLQRAWLLPKDGPADPVAEAKFSLDSAVGDEGQPLQHRLTTLGLTLGLSSGANFSSGEKQLLALSRALVKNSKVIVLVRY